MNAFIVELGNRPGEMARVTELLAAQEVNILLYGLGLGTQGAIAFVPNDEDRARGALNALGARGQPGIRFREVPLIYVRMEDKPGEAARVSRQLAIAGVNIEAWLPVNTSPDNFIVAIGVNNVEAATRGLSDQVTDWTYR